MNNIEKIYQGEVGDGNGIQGFYYDAQLKNRVNCMTLHVNTDKNGDKWDKASGETDGDGAWPYKIEALCTSILAEDYSVTVANNWTDFGGNAIGQLWSTFKPLAPYAKEVMKGINKMYTNQKKTSSQTDSSVIANGMKKGVEFLHGMVNKYGDKITTYLNSSLVVQGTRFSYYDGTGIAFSNLGMKFTVFPKFNGTEVITVPEQVEKMFPYFIGRFDAINVSDTLGESWKDYNGMFAWQKPPAGFEADMKDISNADLVQKGTLKLKLGPHYYINNLVCGDASFTYSKQLVKTVKGSEIKLSPLYCDVAITLKPVTKFSDGALRKFALGIIGSETENKEITKLQTEINGKVS